MKVVLLAGGLGSRISEESHLKPKPMIEIGGKPIIWHIMKIYGYYGFHDFIICCGYKGYLIKEYFSNYFLHMSDVTFNLKDNKMTVHHKFSEPWNVTLVDTGENTQTGGRLLKIKDHIEDTFCLTYGDGLTNQNLEQLVSFHKKEKRLATVTAVNSPSRFGSLKISGGVAEEFIEKPIKDNSWISGGFFVFEKKVLNLIKDEKTILEKEPLAYLAKNKQLSVYKHNKFWYPMDTLRDKNFLQNLWDSNEPPWKVWK